MKKTITSLMALSMVSVASAEVTAHGTSFNVSIDSAKAIQNVASPANTNYEILHWDGDAAWTNASVTNVKGLYFHDNAGLKFNHYSAVTVTYLHIGDGIVMKGSESNVQKQINWSYPGLYKSGFSMSSTEGAWLDINSDFGALISLSNLTNGSVYLNDFGTLSGVTLADSNTVYANALTLSELPTESDLYTVSGTTVTRTLLEGDFSNWNGNVVLSGVADYTVNKTATGLTVTYSGVPEPTTATLSLLALAGLAARRRRK